MNLTSSNDPAGMGDLLLKLANLAADGKQVTLTSTINGSEPFSTGEPLDAAYVVQRVGQMADAALALDIEATFGFEVVEG